MNSILRLHHILSSPHDAKNLGDWDYYTRDDVPDGTRTEHVFDGESSYSKSVPVHSMGSSVFVTEETLEPMGPVLSGDVLSSVSLVDASSVEPVYPVGSGDTLSAMSLVDASSIYPVFGHGGSDAIGSSFGIGSEGVEPVNAVHAEPAGTIFLITGGYPGDPVEAT